MTFNQAQKGPVLQINKIDAPLKFRQKLESMGLIRGQQLRIIGDSVSGRVAIVKNVRLAIGRDLGAQIEVSRA
ncbi:MAG: ferrous iron transport protein A [Coriobacteriales bacterium]|jgi:Fe2+ transport system protein FeoA|nr:ferrous iron transport protein A [Coriobacteriales bacterium]